jgi:hypothetical protein
VRDATHIERDSFLESDGQVRRSRRKRRALSDRFVVAIGVLGQALFVSILAVLTPRTGGSSGWSPCVEVENSPCMVRAFDVRYG